MRRLLLIAAGIALTVVAITAQMSSASATPFAGAATDYQNATIANAMAKVPGGTRVSVSQVEWNNRTMVLTVPAAPTGRAAVSPDAGGCPYSYFCAWDGYSYTGTGAACVSSYYAGGPYFCYIANLLSVVHSYSNVTAYRAWLQQYASHTNAGNEICINSRNYSGNSNGSYNGSSRYDDWVWMSDNTASC
jgi:hypothetical protein